MKNLDVKMMHPAEQIAIIISRIYLRKMTTTSGGNVSIMDDNGDLWITPAGIDKGSLTPDDIVCVKADGTIIGKHTPTHTPFPTLCFPPALLSNLPPPLLARDT